MKGDGVTRRTVRNPFLPLRLLEPNARKNIDTPRWKAVILVILQHFVKPGRVEMAERRINANGGRMATMPGFLFRHATVSSDDPNKLVTVTAWESRERYHAWLERQRTDARAQVEASAEESPYARVEAEVFDVRTSHQHAATRGTA